jgi:hypothetical protein
MLNSRIYYLIFLIFLACLVSCRYAVVPKKIKNKFGNYNSNCDKNDTNSIHFNKCYYTYGVKFYRPSKNEKLKMYRNGKLVDTIINNSFYESKFDIIFFQNGLCYLTKDMNFVLDHLGSNSSINSFGSTWGQFKILKDTIKVKYIDRGSINAGISSGELWFQLKNLKNLDLIHIINLMNPNFYNPTVNKNLDSIKFSETKYTLLDSKIVINSNNNWLINKKWFWASKKEYKKWKKNAHK